MRIGSSSSSYPPAEDSFLARCPQCGLVSIVAAIVLAVVLPFHVLTVDENTVSGSVGGGSSGGTGGFQTTETYEPAINVVPTIVDGGDSSSSSSSRTKTTTTTTTTASTAVTGSTTNLRNNNHNNQVVAAAATAAAATSDEDADADADDTIELMKRYYDENDDPFEIGPDVTITEGQHVSSPEPTDSSCSCWNETSECCNRGVHPTHKFGHLLVTTHFGKDYNPNWNGEGTTRSHPSPEKYFDRVGGIDYREVFITRNWFDAFVSGYLYHKTGHECWLNGHKAEIHPVPKSCKCLDVQRFLLLPKPYPPLLGRNLCTYLFQESEEDGMRVYIEWCLRRYYVYFIRTFKAVQQHEDPAHRRTKFLCFEDLVNPVTERQTVIEIVDWLYPGGPQEKHLPPEKTEDITEAHGTSHDPELRNRLISLVKKLDEEVFNGLIRKSSDMFGCGTD